MKLLIRLLPVLALMIPCSTGSELIPVKKQIIFAANQYKGLLKSLPDSNCFPRASSPDGSLRCTRMNSWTEGFFPGSGTIRREQPFYFKTFRGKSPSQ